MKKRTWVLSVLLLFAFLGCTNPYVGDSEIGGAAAPSGGVENPDSENPGFGALSVALDAEAPESSTPGAQSVMAAQSLAAASSASWASVEELAAYYVSLYRRGSDERFGDEKRLEAANGVPHSDVAFERVPAGLWTVKVRGEDALGNIVLEGSRSNVLVEADARVTVTMVLFRVGSEVSLSVPEEEATFEEPAAEEPITAPTALDGFQSAVASSAISYAEFMVKGQVHNVGSPPYAEYNVNSWNGYLEKHLEAGDVESNLRITAASPHYGSNAIGYENPYSENEHRSVVLNVLNLGVFNYLRNHDPYRSMIPPAVILTRHAYFDHGREDDSYIRENIDILKGVIVFFKPDNRSNDEVQVYYIKEDGSKSDLVPIHEILNP